MCLRRSQEIIAQSYTRLVTRNIVAHITLTIRFVLKKTYVACLLLQMRRTFESQTYTIDAYITLAMCVCAVLKKLLPSLTHDL